MYRACGLRLCPSFGMRLTAERNFYLRLSVEKMHVFVLQFSLRNIYGYTPVVAPILQLRLTIETKKLKYELKPSKHTSLECKFAL